MITRNKKRRKKKRSTLACRLLPKKRNRKFSGFVRGARQHAAKQSKNYGNKSKRLTHGYKKDWLNMN